MKRLLLVICLSLVLSPFNVQALSLEEGLKIITETGRDVKIAQSNEESSREAVSLARSPWLPFVDLYGRETWLQYQPQVVTPNGAFATSQQKFATYGIRATQLLYDFGKTSAGIDAARYGLQTREIETVFIKNQSALEFVVAYLDLLESDKLLQVAAEEVKNYEAHKRDTEVRLQAGVVTRNEVLQVDVTLADSRQRLLSAENLRSVRESRIDSLLLRPLNDPVVPEEIKAGHATTMTLEEAWTSAEASRPRLCLRVQDASNTIPTSDHDWRI